MPLCSHLGESNERKTTAFPPSWSRTRDNKPGVAALKLHESQKEEAARGLLPHIGLGVLSEEILVR
jgi:hypothetical protein